MTKVSPVSPLPFKERQGRLERTGDLLRLVGRKVLPVATIIFLLFNFSKFLEGNHCFVFTFLKVLPMATIVFVLVYWAVASAAYFDPTLQYGA